MRNPTSQFDALINKNNSTRLSRNLLQTRANSNASRIQAVPLSSVGPSRVGLADPNLCLPLRCSRTRREYHDVRCMLAPRRSRRGLTSGLGRAFRVLCVLAVCSMRLASLSSSPWPLDAAQRVKTGACHAARNPAR